MKKIVLSLIVVASVLTACKSEKKEKVTVKEAVKEAVKVAVNVSELNNIDTAVSVLNWEGTKPGGAHNGTVDVKSGGLLVNDGTLIGGQFIFDMTAIKVIDIPAEEKANGDLVGHLSSEDFFAVNTYPTSNFVITKVEGKNEKLNITGNLRVKDVTKSITITPILLLLEDILEN